jgi:hypothetical protein
VRRAQIERRIERAMACSRQRELPVTGSDHSAIASASSATVLSLHWRSRMMTQPNEHHHLVVGIQRSPELRFDYEDAERDPGERRGRVEIVRPPISNAAVTKSVLVEEHIDGDTGRDRKEQCMIALDAAGARRPQVEREPYPQHTR